MTTNTTNNGDVGNVNAAHPPNESNQNGATENAARAAPNPNFRQTAMKSVGFLSRANVDGFRLNGGVRRQLATKAVSSVPLELSRALRRGHNGSSGTGLNSPSIIHIDDDDEEDTEDYEEEEEGDREAGMCVEDMIQTLAGQTDILTRVEAAINKQTEVIQTLNGTLLQLVGHLLPTNGSTSLVPAPSSAPNHIHSDFKENVSHSFDTSITTPRNPISVAAKRSSSEAASPLDKDDNGNDVKKARTTSTEDEETKEAPNV